MTPKYIRQNSAQMDTSLPSKTIHWSKRPQTRMLLPHISITLLSVFVSDHWMRQLLRIRLWRQEMWPWSSTGKITHIPVSWVMLLIQPMRQRVLVVMPQRPRRIWKQGMVKQRRQGHWRSVFTTRPCRMPRRLCSPSRQRLLQLWACIRIKCLMDRAVRFTSLGIRTRWLRPIFSGNSLLAHWWYPMTMVLHGMGQSHLPGRRFFRKCMQSRLMRTILLLACFLYQKMEPKYSMQIQIQEL